MTTKTIEDIEHICRKYANVLMRDEPYDAELKKLVDGVVLTYGKMNSSREDNDTLVSKVVGELEDFRVDTGNSLLRRFSKRNEPEYDNIEELGDKIMSKGEGLKSLQNLLTESCNQHTEFVYNISASLRAARGFADSYEEKSEEIERELRELYDMHNDSRKLKRFVNSLIRDKEKKESNGNEEKKLSKEERDSLSKFFISAGESRLEGLSRKYLEMKNDLVVAGDLISYEAIREEYNQVVNSIREVGENLREKIREISNVVFLYQAVTKRELDFLKDIRIPEKFTDAVNDLSDRIGKVDSEFSEVVLDAMINRTKINPVEFSEVTHDLVSHLKEKYDTSQSSGDIADSVNPAENVETVESVNDNGARENDG